MIHDIEVGPADARPIVRMCNLIIGKCLASGHTSIRLAEGEAVEGLDTIARRSLGPVMCWGSTAMR